MKLTQTADYIIYFDHVRVDQYVYSWNTFLGLSTEEAGGSITFFRSPAMNNATWKPYLTPVRIFVKNVFTQKYTMVFEGEITDRTWDDSRSNAGKITFALQGYHHWLLTPVSMLIDTKTVLNSYQRFIYRAQGINVEGRSELYTTADALQFKDKTIKEAIDELCDRVFKTYTTGGDESSFGFVDIKKRIQVLHEVAPIFRQAKFLDYYTLFKTNQVDTFYTYLFQLLSELMYEFYQDRDGTLNIKNPFWTEPILKNHVIDESVVAGMTGQDNWSQEPTRILAIGGNSSMFDSYNQNATDKEGYYKFDFIPHYVLVGNERQTYFDLFGEDTGISGQTGLPSGAISSFTNNDIIYNPDFSPNGDKGPNGWYFDFVETITAGFTYPYERVINGAKQGKAHLGIDIDRDNGQPIYNIGGSGRVVEYNTTGKNAQGKETGYGLSISVEQKINDVFYIFRYTHLSSLNSELSKGDSVNSKTLLGYVGATGDVTGPHIHFEILKKGTKRKHNVVYNENGNVITGSSIYSYDGWEPIEPISFLEKINVLASGGTKNAKTLDERRQKAGFGYLKDLEWERHRTWMLKACDEYDIVASVGCAYLLLIDKSARDNSNNKSKLLEVMGIEYNKNGTSNSAKLYYQAVAIGPANYIQNGFQRKFNPFGKATDALRKMSATSDYRQIPNANVFLYDEDAINTGSKQGTTLDIAKKMPNRTSAEKFRYALEIDIKNEFYRSEPIGSFVIIATQMKSLQAYLQSELDDVYNGAYTPNAYAGTNDDSVVGSIDPSQVNPIGEAATPYKYGNVFSPTQAESSLNNVDINNGKIKDSLIKHSFTADNSSNIDPALVASVIAYFTNNEFPTSIQPNENTGHFGITGYPYLKFKFLIEDPNNTQLNFTSLNDDYDRSIQFTNALLKKLYNTDFGQKWTFALAAYYLGDEQIVIDAKNNAVTAGLNGEDYPTVIPFIASALASKPEPIYKVTPINRSAFDDFVQYTIQYFLESKSKNNKTYNYIEGDPHYVVSGSYLGDGDIDFNDDETDDVDTISNSLGISPEERLHKINLKILEKKLIRYDLDNEIAADANNRGELAVETNRKSKDEVTTVGFKLESDRDFINDLIKRYAKYGMQLHRGKAHILNLSLAVSLPFLRPGMNVWIEPSRTNVVSYLTGVSHQGQYAQGATTTLRTEFTRKTTNFHTLDTSIFLKDRNGTVNVDSSAFGTSIPIAQMGNVRSKFVALHNQIKNTPSDYSNEIVTDAHNSLVSLLREHYGETKYSSRMNQWNKEYTASEIDGLIKAYYAEKKNNLIAVRMQRNQEVFNNSVDFFTNILFQKYTKF